jgi:tripartite-type tricarboxylate transporter receptor subunit TctC
MGNNVTRRSVLNTAGITSAVGILGGLAGCSSNNTGGDVEETGDSGYPNQPITVMVPYAEGGGTDVWARNMNPQLNEVLGTGFQVENIDGGGGLRGVGQLVQSDPDGYYIGHMLSPLQPMAYLVNPLDFELTDLKAIAQYGRASFVVVVNSKYDVNNIDDLMQRYDSGEFETLGGLGRGSATHAQAYLARENWGLDWNRYVSYPGGGSQVEAAANDEVPATFTTDSSGRGFVESGDVRVIGALHSDGSGIYPDAVPITEQGYDGFDFVSNFIRALWAPPGTPDSIIDTVEGAVETALQQNELVEWANSQDRVIEFNGSDTTNEILENIMKKLPEQIDLEEFREAAK